MATHRQMKIAFRKEQNDVSRLVQAILAALMQADAKASLLPFEKAIASRTLVKKLWDALPEEHSSYQFADVAEQTSQGREYLPTHALGQPVTLHLGWDVLGFSCSLEAAWQCWEKFSALNTDTFNCCIYPGSLEWYIVRAGNNLYPMIFSERSYELRTKQSGQ